MNVHRRAGVLIVSIAIAFTACENGNAPAPGNPFAAPSAFGDPAPFVGARVLPLTIGFTPVPTFGCPLIPPLRSSFSLAIDHRTGRDIFLEQVDFRFVDRVGLLSPLRLTREDLTGMFGPTLVPSGTTRTFDFHPQFGCGFVSDPSFLFADLLFRDASRATHRSTVTATVR